MNPEEIYRRHKVGGLSDRYLTLSHTLGRIKQLGLEKGLELIGKSERGQDIYAVKIGSGDFRILIWSQMHGNETTTTRAVVDLLSFLSRDGDRGHEFLQKFSFQVIPVLNPDGAIAYTRENANGIDLNRDAQNLSQSESRVLRSVFESYRPQLCLNMHDQRTIYSAGDVPVPATISFLSPAADAQKTLTAARKTAMGYITAMYDSTNTLITSQIGRYNDTFNPDCTGDGFQAAGTPTVLVEAGHFPGDYARKHTRKYVFLALLGLLRHISSGRQAPDYERYFSIPENRDSYRDVLIENARVTGHDSPVTVAVQFEEQLREGAVAFVAVVDEIGHSVELYGHQIVDAGGGNVRLLDGGELVPGIEVFSLRIGNKSVNLQDLIKTPKLWPSSN